MYRKRTVGIGPRGVSVLVLWLALGGVSDASETAAVVDEMCELGDRFDPTGLVERGLPGLRSVLDRALPETVDVSAAERAEARRRVGRLNALLCRRREAAAAWLRTHGAPHIDLVQKAASRRVPLAESILSELRARRDEDGRRLDERAPTFSKAFRKYLAALPGEESHVLLAERSARALQARLDQTPRSEVVRLCLLTISKSRNDDVHERLLPLLENEDPAVPIFAMKVIAGRPGNSYVAPIHMGALQSGRRELMHESLHCMPCPVWDKDALPIIRAAYEKIFDGTDPNWAPSDDPDEMRLRAFVAARDFGVKAARDYLLKKTASKSDDALDAIRSLGDTYYWREPVYPELLEALSPHFDSEDPRFRRAAVATVGYYYGDEVVARLVAATADSDDGVVKEACDRLRAQCFHPDFDRDIVLKAMRDAIESSDNLQQRERLEGVVRKVEEQVRAFLQGKAEREAGAK